MKGGLGHHYWQNTTNKFKSNMNTFTRAKCWFCGQNKAPHLAPIAGFDCNFTYVIVYLNHEVITGHCNATSLHVVSNNRVQSSSHARQIMHTLCISISISFSKLPAGEHEVKLIVLHIVALNNSQLTTRFNLDGVRISGLNCNGSGFMSLQRINCLH